LLFLGDYIDRGPQSRAVVDRLLRLRDEGQDVRFLRGNHEAALLDFLENPDTGQVWMAHSGAETLYSYGVSAPGRQGGEADFERASRALKKALPATHLQFFQNLEAFVQLGDYLFVHAGLRPGRPLEKQTESDLLEIREPFLKSRGRWPFVIVHGHSPVNDAASIGGRIALDTAAYATGKLSAVRLEGESTKFLST
jgi:serine/threonine protein phosphatase 1